ncbi:MAG: dTMP kinase [Sedimenticolaceae bacterium]|jgi:dTMP kinase
MTGKFITVEGIEGAGKTTCMQVVTEVIEHQGINAIHTREPGGTDLGEDLRSLLLGHKHTGMSDDAELLMMFAARAEHIAQKIQPALDDGKWVLCDRFTDATYAYQGYGRGIPLEKIAGLENWVQGELRPDLTLLMDLPVEVGMERAGKRSAPDRFESEAWDFFERIRQGYLSIAAEQPSRVKVIDASQDLPDVQAQVRVAIEDFVNA